MSADIRQCRPLTDDEVGAVSGGIIIVSGLASMTSVSRLGSLTGPGSQPWLKLGPFPQPWLQAGPHPEPWVHLEHQFPT
jgi:hypothetical protein